MGLFSSPKACPVCGEPVKGHLNAKIKDNAILCKKCSAQVTFMDASMLPFQSVEDIKDFFAYRENNRQIFQNFQPTREIKTNGGFFRIDENQRLWYYGVKKATNPPIFSYNEIINYELQENGDVITKGGLGQAVVGGVLFGEVGAVVGGVTGGKRSQALITNLSVRISLSNKYKKQLSVNFLMPDVKYKANSITYKMYRSNANELISLLENMCRQVSLASEAQAAQPSPADEILKYKNLLDGGIITQEEFEAKKRQLLNL